MSMKDGAGDLNLGGEQEDDSEDDESGAVTSRSSSDPESDPATERTTAMTATEARSETEAQDSTSTADETHDSQYPYFIRRNNVTDERNKRIELHLRQDVADSEEEFRKQLADELGVSSVSKTDAREFALILAQEHPEMVADLMREEGYGAV